MLIAYAASGKAVRYATDMAVTAMKAKSAVDSLRDVVQDLLVPELKAVKMSVDSLRTEMKLSDDALRAEMKGSIDTLRADVVGSADALRAEMKGSIDTLRADVMGSADAQRADVKGSADALRAEVKGSIDTLRTEMRLQDEKQTQAIQHLSEKLDIAISIRERLAVLEARQANA